ncbi:hypothetical protein [Chitinophaga nivalis]|uniref:Uncharacterized protein n=1 Tax=Chitinophaga nivalis TaxID=2991709 RepID=A0ABT3ISG6_9BACT|nr:hypothetical protein [Chitinophaga nivalis]MCW3463383.1 hypothetical protein [Chitinophaga nivalis]MCW3486927.1 hypothetical protein [Chitinophaga nivalis]
MRLTLLLIFSLMASAVAAQQKAWLIVPGKSVGQIQLEAPAQSLEVLGKPDAGDAAMMKAWRIWYSRRKDKTIDSAHVLAVFTAMRTQDTQYVKQIRVTSPRFRTDRKVGAGSTIAAIKKAYPAIKLVKIYESANKARRIWVYDDNAAGIAFETSNTRSSKPVCNMVVVHDPGEPAAGYLDYHVGFDLMNAVEP